jgi:hypothetical protein
MRILEKMNRIDRIRELLHPKDKTYSAEPIDIEDARWLLKQYELCLIYVAAVAGPDE